MTAPARRQALLAGVSQAGIRELEAIWPKLNLSSPSGIALPLASVLAEVADQYGAAAATLAADWYEEARFDAGFTDAFTVAPAALPDQSRFNALARWGVGPLFGANPDPATALSRVSGGLQRIVLGQARDTTVGAIAEDPANPTYARHASANACAFCALVASRGPVYTSEATAGLGARYHDDCHCAVVEVFPGQEYAEAPYVAKWRDAYNEAKETTDSGAIDTRTTLSNLRTVLGTS